MKYLITILTVLPISSLSIGQVKQPNKAGLIHKITHFYDTLGNPTFTDLLRVWYKDSTVVEEIHRTKSVKKNGITTVTYPVILYRYIHLPSKVIYDYKNFSDTAEIINKAVLPDSLMQDYGWSFYSDKISRIIGIPDQLGDTLIDNVIYRRLKFTLERDDPQKNFMIGYLRCDGKGQLFSFEKAYSRQLNCTMVKSFDFLAGREKPYASQEIFFISDSLSEEETKVFDAWERNTRIDPVNRNL